MSLFIERIKVALGQDEPSRCRELLKIGAEADAQARRLAGIEDPVLVCKTCGCAEVEEPVWRNINTHEINTANLAPEYFCKDCGVTCDVEPQL